MTFDDLTTLARAHRERAFASPATRRLLEGEFYSAELAMLTLQMYHYVKYTVSVFDAALARVPSGAEHEPLRQMLRFFATDEAGHDRVALRDLARMGYDAVACEQTLPLPSTLALHGCNQLAVQEYGPYYLVGETYATETVGAEISRRIEQAYAGRAEVSFYAVHAEADPAHATRSEHMLRAALAIPGTERALWLGTVTALHNLSALPAAVLASHELPAAFQLPRAAA